MKTTLDKTYSPCSEGYSRVPTRCRGHFSGGSGLTEHLRLNGHELLHARTFWWDATTNERLSRDEAVKRTRPPQ